MFSPSEPDTYPQIKKEKEKDKGPYKPSNKEIFKGLKKKSKTMAKGSVQNSRQK